MSSPLIPSKMSLFTSGMAASFDNLRVYRSRGSEVGVSVGSASRCDLLWQARNGIPAAKVRSVVLNDQRRFSPVAEKCLKVDYTMPAFRTPVNVELCRSDRTPASLGLLVRWNAVTDPHSGVVMYEYGIASDVRPDEIRWMGVTQRPQVSMVPMFRLSDPYYIAVRTVNGAGLFSEPVFSKIPQASNVKYKKCEPAEGFAKEDVSSWSYDDEEDDLASGVQGQQQEKNGEFLRQTLRLWPNPVGACIWVRMPSSSAIVRVFDANGRIVLENRVSEKGLSHEKDIRFDVASFGSGVYFVQTIGHDGVILHGTFLKR